ncbi:MAG TPA: choice-of-anchor Q domain-containing protein, partial [Phototrophicaceae bacterium]|nr:choice-of-anchor Q domain-containing protein [Phototrophicaceae bacterium]
MTRSGLTFFSWLLAVLLVFIPFDSTQAAEQSCDEAGLNAAIAAGGSHTFACGGPTTITVTATKTISTTLTLDGGGLLTISGGDARQIFTVSGGVTLTLQNLTLAHGHAAANNGGAINNNGTVSLVNVTLADNYSAFNGGAIFGGIMTFTNSVVSGNQAASSGGAVSAGGQLNIANSIFSNNVANGIGGALDGGANRVNISGSTFTGNRTTSGAGGAINQSGIANIANTTFSGNTAATTGGALSSSTTLNVNITNSTFYNNQAADGGSVYQSSTAGTVTIQDSILAGGNCIKNGGTFTTWTGNLSDSSCPGRIGAPTGLDTTLADNGGPTPTHQLLPGSNAIDAALTCKYRSTGTNPLFSDNTAITTDQRGANRLPPCDIGAVEYTPTVRVIDGSSATISNGGSVDYPVRRTTDAAQSKTFTIENWSGEALTLTPPSSYPSGCALVGGFPTSISFGGSATFQVECTAGTVGQFSGTISFATSDPTFNPFSFTLYHFAQAAGVIGAGTARSCTGLAFDLALADVVAGGAPPFNCGASPATIVTTGQKNIDAAITLDGGGRITLSGGHQHRLFYIGAAGALTLKNLTLTQGYMGGSGTSASGGAIYNDAGALT